MEYGKMLYLTRSDVEACGVTMDQSLAISEATYAEHARGDYEMPPKPGVHPQATGGVGCFLHAMPGYLPKQEICGIKWVSVFGHNKKEYGINSAAGMMILNDVYTGYPIAVMEAGLITAIRTANGSGVACKYLAKKNAKVLGIVGTGEQGRNTLEVICHVMPSIEEVKIIDLFPEFAEKVAKDYADRVHGAKIRVCKTNEEVIRDSDIVVTTAPLDPKNGPVYDGAWVKKGALVLPVHCYGWSYEFFKSASKYVIDDWNQYSNYMFGKGKYFDFPAPQDILYCQLGDLINGVKPARENDDEIIVAANLGIALQDIALGKRVLAIAKEKGLGQTISLF